MTIDPIRLARELIDIPSPTDNEREVGEALERILSDIGFACERQSIGDTRFNLFASAGGVPRVVLCTHIDTVPPFFASSEDDQHVYGRGACDTKGILAAMVASAEQLSGRGARDFALLLVVGEETDSLGAKRANEHFANMGSEYIVVGEPTGSKFVLASKGAFHARVEFAGVAAHSAYPELGDSAILKMARAVHEIDSANWGTDPVIGRGTANVGVVRGGVKSNIVPASAEIEIIFRTVGPPDDVRATLEKIAARHDGRIVASQGGGPVRMLVPPGEEPIVVAFGSDVPHLGNLGKPLLFGPGSIHDAHTANEKISKREIFDAVATYRRLVVDLLEGKLNA